MGLSYFFNIFTVAPKTTSHAIAGYSALGFIALAVVVGIICTVTLKGKTKETALIYYREYLQLSASVR